MTDVLATTSGYFPRPDYLRETLKEVEGYQKEDLDPEAEEEVEEVFERGREEVVGIHEDAGIDLVTEGQLSWDDILAYPATRIDGVEMGGIVRFYDNNRFYREPKVVDEIEHSGEMTVQQYESASVVSDARVKPVMAGPYSLVELSEDEHYGDDDGYLEAFAGVVNEELGRLDDAGAEVIQLDEPSLTDVEEVSIPRDKGVGAVERACEGIDADVVVQTYFGDVSDVYPQLLEAADGIGIDLVSGGESEGEEASAAPNLEALREHGAPDTLAVGCIDSRNTRLETFDEVSTSVDEVLNAAGEGGEEPSTVHVTPNCGLDFLPWNVMQEKVERTGEAVEKIDKEV